MAVGPRARADAEAASMKAVENWEVCFGGGHRRLIQAEVEVMVFVEMSLARGRSRHRGRVKWWSGGWSRRCTPEGYPGSLPLDEVRVHFRRSLSRQYVNGLAMEAKKRKCIYRGVAKKKESSYKIHAIMDDFGSGQNQNLERRHEFKVCSTSPATCYHKLIRFFASYDNNICLHYFHLSQRIYLK